VTTTKKKRKRTYVKHTPYVAGRDYIDNLVVARPDCFICGGPCVPIEYVEFRPKRFLCTECTNVRWPYRKLSAAVNTKYLKKKS